MALLTCWIFTIGLYFQEILAENKCRHTFSIVIDGGSSGTRLSVFRFGRDERQYPRINQNFTFKNAIALSTFSSRRDNWNFLRIMVKNLTDNALTVVPSSCLSVTPLYLQVTAGIRRLGERMGSIILTHLRDILSKTQFIFRNQNIDVLTSTKEALFAWISVNYLLDNFTENRTTVGILDLGGGSTQIAFENQHQILTKDISVVKVLGQTYSIYAQGYEKMGINEIRVKYLKAQQCYSSSDCRNVIFRSQCIDRDVVRDFRVWNQTLLIGGQIIRDCKRFCHCFGEAIRFIKPIISVRSYFSSQTFVAFSAYYFILKNARGILRCNSDGLCRANVRDIIIRAMDLCENTQKLSKSSRFDHFLCVDLSYIAALLHNGYSFEWYDEVVSTMKIRNINLSWALGFAISQF